MITDLEIQTWNNKRPDTLLITAWTSQQLVIPQLAALAVRWLILPTAFLINCWKAAYSAQFNFPTRPSKASHQASNNDARPPRHRKLLHNPSRYRGGLFSTLLTKTYSVCPTNMLKWCLNWPLTSLPSANEMCVTCVCGMVCTSSA